MEGRTHEAVFNQLQSQVDESNDLYNKALGLDVNFRVATITVIDGGLVEAGGTCGESNKNGSDVAGILHKNNLIKTSTQFGESLDKYPSVCFSDDEANTITKIAKDTAADIWVLVDSTNERATAGAPIGVSYHIQDTRSYTLAHELGHLLGLDDLYMGDTGRADCASDGPMYGRLMCGSASLSSAESIAKLFSVEEAALVRALVSSTACYGWSDNECQRNTMITMYPIMGTGAAIAPEIVADDGTTLPEVTLMAMDESNPTVDVAGNTIAAKAGVTFKVRLSSAPTKPVYVQLHSFGTNATVGTNYQDTLTQTLMFAAGEREKVVSTTVTPATDVRSLQVELSNAIGATVGGQNAYTVTIAGTGSSNNNSGSGEASSKSSGGGSIGGFGLVALGMMGLLRRKMVK